jgi:hypothetical protein
MNASNEEIELLGQLLLEVQSIAELLKANFPAPPAPKQKHPNLKDLMFQVTHHQGEV